MLPTTKQSSRLGSQTADSLVNQRPVCMSCLMDVSKGDLVVIADVSYILMLLSIQEVRTLFPVQGEKKALDMLKEWPSSWETAWLFVFFRHRLS